MSAAPPSSTSPLSCAFADDAKAIPKPTSHPTIATRTPHRRYPKFHPEAPPVPRNPSRLSRRIAPRPKQLRVAMSSRVARWFRRTGGATVATRRARPSRRTSAERSALAVRTVMRTACRQHDPLDGCLADVTRLALACVHSPLVLVGAVAAVWLHVVADARAARLDRAQQAPRAPRLPAVRTPCASDCALHVPAESPRETAPRPRRCCRRQRPALGRAAPS